MSSAHDLPMLIQWHEGMLLAPQHFQQLVQRSDRLLQYHQSLGVPYHYGLNRLRYESTQLFTGTFRISELEAVLSDGIVIAFRTPGDGDLQVDLRPHAEAAKQGPVTIYLAVPAERSGGSKGDGDLGRYSSVPGDEVDDETSAGRPLRIPRLKPRLRLIAGTEAPPPRFVSLPLLSVVFKNGAFVPSDYIAPMMRVAVDSVLGELCAQVSSLVRAKATYLVEIIRSPAITTKPAVIEESRRLLSHLSVNLPPFEALLATGTVHPYSLYVALTGLAGAAASVGSQPMPPVFPAYDHLNLRQSFGEVLRFIQQSLSEGISEAFAAIPFKNESGLFTLNFEREWMRRTVILGFKGSPGATDQQITEWVASSLIGTSSKFKVLRERRLLGAVRQPIDKYEGLVATRGMLLFQLQVSPEYVVAHEQLMVGNSAEKAAGLRPAEAFLYVANKE